MVMGGDTGSSTQWRHVRSVLRVLAAQELLRDSRSTTAAFEQPKNSTIVLHAMDALVSYGWLLVDVTKLQWRCHNGVGRASGAHVAHTAQCSSDSVVEFNKGIIPLTDALGMRSLHARWGYNEGCGMVEEHAEDDVRRHTSKTYDQQEDTSKTACCAIGSAARGAFRLRPRC